MSKTILIFFGPPGSGKGTQADMVGEKLNLPVISPGELLRHERDGKTEIGKKIGAKLAKGKLVPDEIVEKIINKRLAKQDKNRGFILDGYPRKKKQLDCLIRRLNKITDTKNGIYAILINVSDKDVRDRLGGRRVCDCGASYHIKYNPPKKKGICDLCGQKLYIRKDDNPAVINSRLRFYHNSIKPLLDYWERSGKFIRINGEQSIKKVQNDIIKKLREKKVILK